MGVLTVLYGTQSGCAEIMAYTLTSLAMRRGFEHCRCLPADEFQLENWKEASPLVIICSNTNQGEAPESIRISWAKLLQPTAPSMESLRFAVFGVGDSLYPKFNYMAKMLHNRLKQLGGVPLVNRGLGDESDAKGVDETFLPWLLQLWRALGRLSPEEEGAQAENPSTAPLVRKFNVDFVDAGVHADAVDKIVHRNESVFDCVVQQNVRLTAEDHFQAVHHVAFSRVVTRTEGAVQQSSPLSFEVGDALGVYCTNRESTVDDFLALLDQKGDALVCVTPNTTEGLIQQKHQPFFGKPMTLQFLLRHYVDLEAVVSRSFFGMLARFTADAEFKERLLELASPEHLDDYMSYAHREKRNVVEVLSDFRTIRPPLSTLLSFMPLMRPRLFSISSAPSFDVSEIHLTVALISWQTPYKRDRKGLCSSRLVGSVPGDVFTCYLWPGTLLVPARPSPLVCVGAGTGIAPLRALIRECAANPGEWGEVPLLLIFGCRHADKDYLYAAEWAELSRERLKKLKVLPAFSRDGAKKFYVQHQLGQHAKRVAQVLDDGACVYVCGKSTPMPKDVSTTFDDIVTQCCCGGDEADGQEYMKQLRKEGRYVMDTWSA
ncbi:P450 reductase [Trypanosoma grayi]|uniref:P450 reductase n=1 Tax=Trypanosoma grayi TaxID=71804 RepID=UPI0004F4AAD6|nr:P450 reductase [Trypanosoma grayi]KEG11813.1 P450 reductase [Trypanosoma grayi]